MSSEVRALLVGAGPTAFSALNALTREFSVVGLLRRRRDLDTPDEVVDLAAGFGVQVFEDMSVDGVRSAVTSLDPDIVVVSSYNRVLPGDVLAGRHWVNVHYAPLPRYRGRAVVNWAIINGEQQAFVTVHSLVPGLDAGGILAQKSVPIGPRDTVTDLYQRLNVMQEELLAEAVRRKLAGDDGEVQDEARATYCCTRVPGDGEIDWAASSAAIDRLVRSLTPPYPGAFTFLGLDCIVVHSAEPVTDGRVWSGSIPGRVVKVDGRSGDVEVLTGDGVIRLLRVSHKDGPIVSPSVLIGSTSMTLGLSTRTLRDELARLRRTRE